jgi:hypothetical protein
MLKTDRNKLISIAENNKIPLIPLDAMAGFGTGSMQVMDYDTKTYIIPEFDELNVDFMIRVKGSSMYPKYNSGDIVGCKKLPLDKNYSLDYLRGKNKKLIELSRVMILKDSNALSQEFKYLTTGVYKIMSLNGVTTLTGVMVKEHFKLYEKFGDFRQEALIKSYGNLGKPFIVTAWHNINNPSKFFKRMFLTKPES